MLEDCPDGILNEEEQNAVIEKLLTFTKEEFKELILDACSDAVKAGITEVQTDDLEYMRKELYGKTILDAYMELSEMQELVTEEQAARYKDLLRQKCDFLRSDLTENRIWEWSGGANMLVTGIVQ